MPAEFFKLGIAEPPEKGDYFVGLQRYMTDHLKFDPNEIEAIHDQQGRASQRPWAKKDYPHIAGWLAVNENVLTLVIEATRRPDYFNPLASHRNEKGRGGLIAALLPGVQKCRELASSGYNLIKNFAFPLAFPAHDPYTATIGGVRANLKSAPIDR